MPIPTGIAQLFDSYARQARLFPALLTIFPPLLTILAWFPWLLLSDAGATLLTLGTSCGLLYALSSYARTKGKRIEPDLLKEWGGWPTTLLLRHDSKLDKHTRLRYHRYLAEVCPGNLSFPTAQQEKKNSAAANAVYDSAVRWLKERARGKEFRMVELENTQYGFRRNLLGLKLFALILCASTLVLTMLSIFNRTPDLLDLIRNYHFVALTKLVSNFGPAILSAFAVNLGAMFAWGAVVTKRWVREAGFQYAYALLAVCDMTISEMNKQKKETVY